jgi:hypothetical protein
MIEQKVQIPAATGTAEGILFRSALKKMVDGRA